MGPSAAPAVDISVARVHLTLDTALPVYDLPAPTQPGEATLKGNGRRRFGLNVRLRRRGAS